MDKKAQFKVPMNLAQKITGIAYIPIHAVLLPEVLVAAAVAQIGADAVDNYMASLNMVLYGFGLLVCLTVFFTFLKKSFVKIRLYTFLRMLFSSLALYYVSSFLVNSFLLVILPAEQGIIDPNTGVVIESANNNLKTMIAIAVFCAPIVEETIFRGALFGAICEKNKTAAYIVTIVLFSVYHLWAYFIKDFSPWLFVYLLQYVPVGYLLCRAYEKSDTIWCPIAIHAIINALALYSSTLLLE